MEPNGFRRLLQDEGFGLGMFSFIPSEIIVELAAYAGFDYLIFDTEHASYDVGSIERQVRAAEAADIASVVRVSNPDPYLIARILDTGPDGLMFARVGSTQTAEEIVRLCRLPPVGDRGVCPGSRAGHYHFMPLDDYTRVSNDVAIVVMIETKEGLAEVEGIVSVTGIDGVAVGRADLSYSLGLKGGGANPRCLEEERRVVSLARQAGLGVMSSVKTPQDLQRYLEGEHGRRVFWYSTETYQIGRHFENLVRTSHELLG